MFIPTHLIVVENKYGLKWLSWLPNYNMQRCDFMMRMTGAHLTLPFYFVVAGVPVSVFFSFLLLKVASQLPFMTLTAQCTPILCL